MPEKIKGTVKWFSNRKGFGFITPSSENAPTKEDIFVHQSSIVTQAEYRTLKDGFAVEFEAVTDENGKLKAQNVTSSDGSPCPGPEPRERRQRKKKTDGAPGGKEEAAEGGADGNKANDGGDDKPKKGKPRRRKNGKKPDGDAPGRPKPAVESWYNELNEAVKKSLADRGIELSTGRAFVTVGDSRMKLGTGGYAALAHSSGLVAEGTYTCDKDGKVAASWSHVLKYDGAEWKPSNADAEKDLVTSIDLTDVNIKPTGSEETTETLWGEGKADPKDALQNNGFKMRKVALHASPGGGRRRGRGRRQPKKMGKNGQDSKEGNGEKV